MQVEKAKKHIQRAMEYTELAGFGRKTSTKKKSKSITKSKNKIKNTKQFEIAIDSYISPIRFEGISFDTETCASKTNIDTIHFELFKGCTRPTDIVLNEKTAQTIQIRVPKKLSITCIVSRGIIKSFELENGPMVSLNKSNKSVKYIDVVQKIGEVDKIDLNELRLSGLRCDHSLPCKVRVSKVANSEISQKIVEIEVPISDTDISFPHYVEHTRLCIFWQVNDNLAKSVRIYEGKCNILIPSASPLVTLTVSRNRVHSITFDFGQYFGTYEITNPPPYTEVVKGDSDLTLDVSPLGPKFSPILYGRYNSRLRHPSALGGCSRVPIHQTHATCYLVAVSLLVSKIEGIYNSLSSSTRAYADVFTASGRPTVSSLSCNLIPKEIRKEYTKLMREHGVKDDSDLLSVERRGGSDELLLEAILKVNHIDYSQVHSIGDSGLSHSYQSMSELTLWHHVFAPCVSYEKKLKRVLEGVIAKSNDRLVGGLIMSPSKEQSKYECEQMAHTFAFTVCKDKESPDYKKIIMCNHGRCSSNFDSNAMMVDTKIEKVLLIFLPYAGWEARPSENKGKGKAYTETDHGKIKHFLFKKSWSQVLKVLAEESTEGNMARNELTTLITKSFDAVFLECAPVSGEMATKDQFEFNLVNSPELSNVHEADESAFNEHFKGGDDVVCFKNIGGDAMLIAPNPIESNSYGRRRQNAYVHLSAFLKFASDQQIHSLWKRVAGELMSCMKREPKKSFWLSTSGSGVHWLHVRIDSSPKYYKSKSFIENK